MVEKRLYRIEEIAEQLGVSRAYVYGLIAAGDLRATKLGRATRIAPEDLEAFVQARRSETQGVAV